VLIARVPETDIDRGCQGGWYCKEQTVKSSRLKIQYKRGPKGRAASRLFRLTLRKGDYSPIFCYLCLNGGDPHYQGMSLGDIIHVESLN
jgi:hypothetical protein